MPKQPLLLLVFLICAGGSVFSDDESEETVSPNNTITADVFLLYSNLVAWGIMGNYCFGTAIQYERQIVDSASVAIRLEYRGMGILTDDGSITNLTGLSAEGHGRYYLPAQDVFFIDGMLGYATFIFADPEVFSVSHYFKFGVKVGWRIDFGKPGGLVLEPSLGHYFAIGRTNIKFLEGTDEQSVFLNQFLNGLYDLIIRGYFVGGPQISLALGYRF